MLFMTDNDFNSVNRVSVSFTADEIKYHATNADIVLAYDRTASPKKVCSTLGGGGGAYKRNS